jgi:hypothetical protein
MLVPVPAGQAGENELDQLLGERRAFSRVADSCSAADTECLRRMREERMYRFKKLNWSQFCSQYLEVSKTEADRIIHRFEEFGQSYFDVSRIVRISPESYRAIAHAVKDKAIEWNGETIALTPENSGRVAAAVQALRQAATPKVQPRAAIPTAAPQPEPRVPVHERIQTLERRAYELTEELRQSQWSDQPPIRSSAGYAAKR